MQRFPVYFISHGGGPWPWMEGMVEGPYRHLAASLRDLPRDAGGRPRAVLMISAHWEAPAFTVQANPQPSMIYDYYGFPEHTYSISYPAPGDPSLAARVAELLDEAGLPATTDPERGFDHGMYAPMRIAWPGADMPTVQLSLMAGLDPATHLAMGRALAALRDEDVLIIGSGLSYHNLRQFGPGAAPVSEAFDGWLHEVMASPPEERTRALEHWEDAPCARQAHPREEHLMPLLVAVGAAEQEAATATYHERGFMGGVTASSFRLGDPADRSGA